MQQHDLSKWVLRGAMLFGIIGFGSLYAARHDWSKGAMPTLTADYRDSVDNLAGAKPGDFPPCQPIGRTAKGELVYSMDCELGAAK